MSLMFPTLENAYAWLNGQINYERNLGKVQYNTRTFELEAFAQRMEALGSPQRQIRTIHIAGTRGKGSAALMMEAILRAAGLRVAVYTSPHLIEYRERIRIDGQPIAARDFQRIMGLLASHGAGADSVRPSFKTVFENLTAAFFVAAHEARVDWAIMETGLGGRLDATNILPPGPALVTRIGLEHTHLLGHTLAAIAAEKAAIIKSGAVAVAGCQAPFGPMDAVEGGQLAATEAGRVFAERAGAVGAHLQWSSDLVRIVRARPTASGFGLTLEYHGKQAAIDLPLLGLYQIENLRNSLGMLVALGPQLPARVLEPENIQMALGILSIPGRMQRIRRDPEVILDGAHCPAGAASLACSMATHFGDEPASLVVAMMGDKDPDAFFISLKTWPNWRQVVCFTGDTERAMDAELLAAAARRHFCNVHTLHGVPEALQFVGETTEKEIRIVVTGSLITLGSFLRGETEIESGRKQTAH